MVDSNDIRRTLQDVRLFIVYRLEPRADGKLDKIPTSPIDCSNINAQDPAHWMLPDEATMWADALNSQPRPPGVSGFGVGVVISDAVVLPNGRRLFCLDIDKCRDGNQWAPHAAAFLAKLPGAGVEVSVSFTGMHAFGTYAGERPEHGTRNKTYGLELYTRLRFIAVTGYGAVGDPLIDLTQELHTLCRDYFPPHDDREYGEELTTVPVPEWSGPTDDDELLKRAMRSHSGASVFGGRAAFADLFNANTPMLARVFPPQQHGDYDGSAADQALTNHLAFWTGNHGERMLRLMWRSALRRNKWERPGYLHNTIQRACGSQRQWYKDPRASQQPAAVTSPAVGSSALVQTSGAPINGVPLPPDRVPEPPPEPEGINGKPAPGSYIVLSDQIKMFDGCVYVQDIHQVMMPEGHALNSEKFDAAFSGYTFAMQPDGQKPARRAWEAFVFSELHAFPKVKGMFFDPRIPARTIVKRDGWELINSYVPTIIVRKQGDVGPFLTHLYKLLPKGDDARILLSYFAACVQYPGEKFQWWPLIQGVEGNGKTTLSYLLEYAIGERYVHWPKAAELGSRFNSAFYGKLLICCEDVYISESRGSLWESLKPMITSTRLEIEAKGVDKVTRDVCFNGVMNSNHKNAIRKTANDRRIGPFFCAQQAKSDLARDGMTRDYFKKLRAWRLGEGREAVADFLLHYPIPDEWNPAGDCNVCPDTTATREAISASLGAAEQEVVEAIGQQLVGFRNGWVSSTALDRLLATIGKGGSIPRNKRRELMESLGYIAHPALPEGRATATDTDGSRPTLYVLPTASGAQESDPQRVMGWYQHAQK